MTNPPAVADAARAAAREHRRLRVLEQALEAVVEPGVAGVYVGLLDDQKTPSLKVMLARKDPKLERSVPRVIEGYPVVTEVTV